MCRHENEEQSKDMLKEGNRVGYGCSECKGNKERERKTSKKARTQQGNEQRRRTCGLIQREQELHPGANPTEN